MKSFVNRSSGFMESSLAMAIAASNGNSSAGDLPPMENESGVS